MKAGSAPAGDMRNFLASLLLFSDLSDSSFSRLEQACRLRPVEKGEYLFIQSDAPESVYIVHSGSVSIVLISPDGREMIINEMRFGEMFGELGLLTGLPRSTGAVVRSSGSLLEIPGDIFLELIDCEPLMARRLLELLARQLQRSGQREGALAFMDAQARLAHLLLELDDQESEKGYITISQQELADRAGLIRQTVAKILGKWRRSGLLITGRGRILVLDHAALEELRDELLA